MRRPRLVQELVPRDLHYPWRVLVCCALLNRTQGAQVRPMLAAFFELVPGPDRVFRVDLRPTIEPLGLYVRRETLLRRMTWDYLSGALPEDCHGAGQYARDALSLFARGLVPDPEAVADRWLRPYAQWRLAGGRALAWDRRGHDAWRERSGFAPMGHTYGPR